MKALFKSLFARWKIIAHKIGEFQSRLILSVFYYIIFAPFALGLRMFSDPLQLQSFHGWTARNDGEGTPEENSRRQF